MTEELKFENPCNYSLEAINIPSISEFDRVKAKLEKHVAEVEKREAELIKQLSKIESAKEGDTGKVTTLAGIARAVSAGFNGGTSEQVQAELDAVRAFKQNGAVDSIRELQKLGDTVVKEVNSYFTDNKFKEHASMVNLPETNAVIVRLNESINYVNWNYSGIVRKCGFTFSYEPAPNGEHVRISLYNSKIKEIKLIFAD